MTTDKEDRLENLADETMLAEADRALGPYVALPAELRDEMPSMGMMLFAQMNMMLVIFAAIGIVTAIVRLK